MQYPSLRDYQNAIINQNNFHIPFFQSESMEIFLNPRGYPFMFVGGFGAIFKFRDKDKREYAFKVFTRDVPDRGKRYQALNDALQKAQLPFMADFHYVPEGLRVKGEPYPAVVMEWGRGIQLDKAIEYDLADDGILQCAPFLAGELYFIVKTLQEHGMGHNDLQEGNILVRDDNKLVLIDYDGMFAPQLANWPPCEMGLPNYQHPLRDKTHFNSKIDDFALISILYQLAVIKPDLWKKHHDDRRLLLKQADYENPGQSELIQFGLKSDELYVRALAKLLVQACSLHPLEIKAIEKIEAVSDIMNWLAIPGEPVPVSQAESAIQWAMALKTDDVAQFEKNQLSGPDSTAAEIKAVKPRKADAGRWKALREYLEAGKAMRQKKTADSRKEKPVRVKTAPRPYARPISSDVKPSPHTPPAQPTPSKSSFGLALATFITLVFKLVLKYINTFNVRIAFAIILLVSTPFCLHQFLEPKTDKSERFIAKGGVVIDTRNSLMWAANDNGSNINWFDAKKYCQNYRGGGFTDWRMPTLYELYLLYDRETKGYGVICEGSNSKVYLTPLIRLTCYWIWAKETRDDGLRVASFYFDDGSRYWLHPSFSSTALPVRDLKSEPIPINSTPKAELENKKKAETPATIKGAYQRRPWPQFFGSSDSGRDTKNFFKLDKNWFPNQYVPYSSDRFHKMKNGLVIKDDATYLMWQQSGSANSMNYNSARKYVNKLNINFYAGYNDWRLPTIDELTTLLTSTKQDSGLYINPVFKTQQSWCWSSDKKPGKYYRRNLYIVFTVMFGYGKVAGCFESESCYVRAVRTVQNVLSGNEVSSEIKAIHPRRSEPITVSQKKAQVTLKLDKNWCPQQYIPISSNRFQKLIKGLVVKDNATGLMWQQSHSYSGLVYERSEKYIKKLNINHFAGYHDWRLPTIDELTSLLTENEQRNSSYISLLFSRIHYGGGCWSSDRRMPSGAWIVIFNKGKVHWNLDGQHQNVRAVRSFQR